MNIPNTVAIQITYLPATNTKGSRIGLFFPLYKKRKAIPYCYVSRDAEDGAVNFFKEQGIHPISRACLKEGIVLLFSFDDVQTIKEIFKA